MFRLHVSYEELAPFTFVEDSVHAWTHVRPSVGSQVGPLPARSQHLGHAEAIAWKASRRARVGIRRNRGGQLADGGHVRTLRRKLALSSGPDKDWHVHNHAGQFQGDLALARCLLNLLHGPQRPRFHAILPPHQRHRPQRRVAWMTGHRAEHVGLEPEWPPTFHPTDEHKHITQQVLRDFCQARHQQYFGAHHHGKHLRYLAVGGLGMDEQDLLPPVEALDGRRQILRHGQTRSPRRDRLRLRRHRVEHRVSCEHHRKCNRTDRQIPHHGFPFLAHRSRDRGLHLDSVAAGLPDRLMKSGFVCRLLAECDRDNLTFQITGHILNARHASDDELDGHDTPRAVDGGDLKDLPPHVISDGYSSPHTWPIALMAEHRLSRPTPSRTATVTSFDW